VELAVEEMVVLMLIQRAVMALQILVAAAVLVVVVLPVHLLAVQVALAS
jgi:hypothetical protein